MGTVLVTEKRRAYMRSYAHREDRKAYQREYLKNWRKQNPGKNKSYDLKWRQANPVTAQESDKRKQKKYYDTHPAYRAKVSVRSANWQKDNPKRHKQNMVGIQNRRRARKYNTTIGPVDFAQILLDSCGLCGICQKQLDEKLEYDHIIPLAKGGAHTQENIQASHATCNRRKSCS